MEKLLHLVGCLFELCVLIKIMETSQIIFSKYEDFLQF
jgi:hypothetical protein